MTTFSTLPCRDELWSAHGDTSYLPGSCTTRIRYAVCGMSIRWCACVSYASHACFPTRHVRRLGFRDSLGSSCVRHSHSHSPGRRSSRVCPCRLPSVSVWTLESAVSVFAREMRDARCVRSAFCLTRFREVRSVRSRISPSSSPPPVARYIVGETLTTCR